MKKCCHCNKYLIPETKTANCKWCGSHLNREEIIKSFKEERYYCCSAKCKEKYVPLLRYIIDEKRKGYKKRHQKDWGYTDEEFNEHMETLLPVAPKQNQSRLPFDFSEIQRIGVFVDNLKRTRDGKKTSVLSIPIIMVIATYLNVKGYLYENRESKKRDIFRRIERNNRVYNEYIGQS